MEKNSQQSSKVIKYTGGVRDKQGEIQRFDNAKDAYNNLYHDVHAKLNGGSSWVKPNTTLETYISKFAPKEDGNNPKTYTNHMVDYFNKILKNKIINSTTTLNEIKNSLLAEGFDAEHEFTKAHLGIEDPKVLNELNS